MMYLHTCMGCPIAPLIITKTVVLNQARTSSTWFLEIAFVCKVGMCVCSFILRVHVSVCLHAIEMKPIMPMHAIPIMRGS